MKLFKGHAVMYPIGHEHVHVVRSYLTLAGCWQEAQLRIGEREPTAALVTIPEEMPEPLLVDVRTIGERECEELREACAWNEGRLRDPRA